MLREQETVGADGRFGLPGAAAGERQEGGRLRIGCRQFAERFAPLGRIPRSAEWRESAHDDGAGNAPQGGRDEAEQVGPATGDERLRRLEAATPFDVFEAGRGVEEHGRRVEPKQSQEDDVKFPRHRMKNQHRVAGADAQCAQPGRAPSGQRVEVGERGDPRSVGRPVEQGRSGGSVDDVPSQDFEDVHGRPSRGRE